jgi:hypothetical protein
MMKIQILHSRNECLYWPIFDVSYTVPITAIPYSPPTSTNTPSTLNSSPTSSALPSAVPVVIHNSPPTSLASPEMFTLATSPTTMSASSTDDSDAYPSISSTPLAILILHSNPRLSSCVLTLNRPPSPQSCLPCLPSLLPQHQHSV